MGLRLDRVSQDVYAALSLEGESPLEPNNSDNDSSNARIFFERSLRFFKKASLFESGIGLMRPPSLTLWRT